MNFWNSENKIELVRILSSRVKRQHNYHISNKKGPISLRNRPFSCPLCYFFPSGLHHSDGCLNRIDPFSIKAFAYSSSTHLSSQYICSGISLGVISTSSKTIFILLTATPTHFSFIFHPSPDNSCICFDREA